MSGLAMGSYGVYVWSCFALTAAVVLICEWRARKRHKIVYRDIEVRVKALGGKE